MAQSTIKAEALRTFNLTAGSGYTLMTGYARRIGRTVFLNCRVSKSSSQTGTSLATIPDGARPSDRISLRVSSSSTTGAPIIIDTDGTLFTTSDAAGDLRVVVTYFTNDP